MPIYVVRRQEKLRVYNDARRLAGQLREDRRNALYRNIEYIEPAIIEFPDDCRLLTLEQLENEISAE